MKEILACKNGAFHGIYPSAEFASRRLRVSRKTIDNCLKNGKETRKGYTFDYPLGANKNG